MDILIVLMTLSQSWGGEPTLIRTPLVKYSQDEVETLRQKIVELTEENNQLIEENKKLKNPGYFVDGKYHLFDNSGQLWEGTDWPSLWNHVQKINLQRQINVSHNRPQ